MSKDNQQFQGGQAFPTSCENGVDGHVYQEGMTLRDYFAGQVLMGLASSMSVKQFNEIANGTIGGKFYPIVAYTLADAMLAERGKE